MKAQTLKIRISGRDLENIKANASANEMTVSEYVRRMAVGRPLKAQRLKNSQPVRELTYEPDPEQQPGESVADYRLRLHLSKLSPEQQRELDEMEERATEQPRAATKASQENDEAQVIRFSKETDEALRRDEFNRQAEVKAVELANGMIF